MTAEGTPPVRFAIEHAHYDEDLDFWRDVAAEVGGPVLDVGSAVGRVSLPLARAGHEVWALDASQGMLDELRRALEAEDPAVARRVTPVRGDFRDFDVADVRFPLALMPMNSLQALLSVPEQLACLRRVHRHLSAGGVFAFDVVVADLGTIARVLGETQPGVSWRDPVSGAILTRSARFDAVDLATGTVSYTAQIEEHDPSGTRRQYERPHTVHIFAPSELWALLHESGFEVQAVYGDFDRSPLDESSERQIYRCAVPA